MAGRSRRLVRGVEVEVERKERKEWGKNDEQDHQCLIRNAHLAACSYDMMSTKKGVSAG